MRAGPFKKAHRETGRHATKTESKRPFADLRYKQRATKEAQTTPPVWGKKGPQSPWHDTILALTGQGDPLIL